MCKMKYEAFHRKHHGSIMLYIVNSCGTSLSLQGLSPMSGGGPPMMGARGMGGATSPNTASGPTFVRPPQQQQQQQQQQQPQPPSKPADPFAELG